MSRFTNNKGGNGGSGVSRLSSLTDVDNTFIPINGDVLEYTDGKWRYAQPNKNNAYTIELDKWNIITGFPNKPYHNSDYILANNNITGINNALSWAKDNGYKYVIFPENDYVICYPNPILTQSNMIIDFNFSRFKVMYDSDVRSPFDESAHPIYHFGGNSILCTTRNTHIINLELIGDRIDRSWSIPDERAMEGSNGIKFGSGADNCSVKNSDISYFMGDAIALYYSPYTHIDIGLMEFGSVNNNGALVAGLPTTVRTVGFINIPIETRGFSMIGLGYAPSTSIPSKMYNVVFYDKNSVFLSYKENIRTRDLVQVPNEASKMKLVWEGNGTVDDGCVEQGNPPYWAILLKGGIADGIIIENNEIHRNHRGGIFLGTNNVTIRNNFFHDTGYAGEKDLDGIPTFTDFTKYSINTEDNVGQNCKIVDNVFENTRMAIALRGDYNEIRGNEFRNCLYGVILYHLNHCTVKDNYFHYSSLGCYEYENFNRNWIIENNIFVGKGIDLSGTGTVSSISNNSFINSSCLSYVQILNFKNNVFNSSSYQVEELNTVADGCTFLNRSTIKIIGVQGDYDNIIRCNFIDSEIYCQNSKKITVRDSYFKDSGYIYSTGATSFNYINCKFNNTKRSIITSNGLIDVGQVKHLLTLLNCKVSLGQMALITSMSWGGLSITDSAINYELTKNLTKALIDFFGEIEDSISIKNTTIKANNFVASQSVSEAKSLFLSDNSFTSFSLDNPTVEIQSNKMNNSPSIGKYDLGHQVLNSNPTSGSYVGWVCVKGGTLNSQAWVTTTAYTLNTLVNANGKVYKCTVAGTSGATAPSHTTGIAIDGTVTWQYVDVLAVFKGYGLIQ